MFNEDSKLQQLEDRIRELEDFSGHGGGLPGGGGVAIYGGANEQKLSPSGTDLSRKQNILLAELQDRLKTLQQDRLPQLHDNLESLNSVELPNLKENLTLLDSKQSDLDQALSDLSDQQGSLDDNLSGLKKKLGDLSEYSESNTLQSKLSGLDTDLGDLHTALGDLSGYQGTLVDEISSLDQQQGTLQQSLSDLQSDLGDTNTRQSTLKSYFKNPSNIPSGYSFFEGIVADDIWTKQTTAMQGWFNDVFTSNLSADIITTNQLKVNQIVGDSAFIDSLVSTNLFANKIVGNSAFIDNITSSSVLTGKLIANRISVDTLVGRQGFFESLTAGTLYSGTAFIDELAAEQAFFDEVTANSLWADKVTAKSMWSGKITTNYLNVDEVAGNVSFWDKVVSKEVLANKITANEAFVGKIVGNEAFFQTMTTDDLWADKVTSDSVWTKKAVSNTIFTKEAAIQNRLSVGLTGNVAIDPTISNSNIPSAEKLGNTFQTYPESEVYLYKNGEPVDISISKYYPVQNDSYIGFKVNVKITQTKQRSNKIVIGFDISNAVSQYNVQPISSLEKTINFPYSKSETFTLFIPGRVYQGDNPYLTVSKFTADNWGVIDDVEITHVESNEFESKITISKNDVYYSHIYDVINSIGDNPGVAISNNSQTVWDRIANNPFVGKTPSDFVSSSGYNAFNPNGTYSGLRAKATTAGDVGLGNVRNVASYSKSEANGKFYDIKNRTKYYDGLSGDLDNAPLGTRGLADTQLHTAHSGFADVVTISQYGSGDGIQIEYPFRGNNEFNFRTRQSSSYNSWKSVWHSGNSDKFDASKYYQKGHFGGIETQKGDQDLRTSDAVRFGTYVESQRTNSNNRYGYFAGLRKDGKRGFYLGYGNGGDTVDLFLDNASKLLLTGNLKATGNVSASKINTGHGNREVNSAAEKTTAYFRNASHLNAGTVSNARLPDDVTFDTGTFNQSLKIDSPGASPKGSFIEFISPAGNIGVNFYAGDGLGARGERWNIEVLSDKFKIVNNSNGGVYLSKDGTLNTGNLEATGHITAPTVNTGTLHTNLFVYDQVKGVGGKQVVGPAATVESTSGSTITLDTPTIPTKDPTGHNINIRISGWGTDGTVFANIRATITKRNNSTYTINIISGGSMSDIAEGMSVAAAEGDMIVMDTTGNIPSIAGYDNITAWADSPIGGDTSASPNWMLNQNEFWMGKNTSYRQGGIYMSAPNKQFSIGTDALWFKNGNGHLGDLDVDGVLQFTQNNSKLEFPPSFANPELNGSIDQSGINLAFNGNQSQSIEWYAGLGTYAGVIETDADGYLNLSSSFGVNIGGDLASEVNLGGGGFSTINLNGNTTLAQGVKFLINDNFDSQANAYVNGMLRLGAGNLPGVLNFGGQIVDLDYRGQINLTDNPTTSSEASTSFLIIKSGNSGPFRGIYVYGESDMVGSVAFVTLQGSSDSMHIKRWADDNNSNIICSHGLDFHQKDVLMMIYDGTYWRVINSDLTWNN